MKFTTKTEYGLICLIHMAKLWGEKKVIPVKDFIKKEGYPKPYIEKIFQSLRDAGVVNAYSGKGGGYALAREPKDINLREILDVLEGGTFEVYCEKPQRDHIVCTHLCLCGVKPVWRKTKELLDGFFEMLTLEVLAKNEAQLDGVSLNISGALSK